MVWVKRVLVGVAIVVVVGILVTALGYRRLRGVPDWYTVRTFTAEQLQRAATSAENKLAGMQNWAAEMHARESAGLTTAPTTRAGGVAGATTRRANETTIEFTADELNAFFQKWVSAEGWGEKFGKYVADPAIFLQDGRVILAGTVKEMNTLASVHFEPKLDAKGNLDLRVVKVLGGKLPLPRAVWSAQKDRLAQAAGKHMPEWRKEAAIGPNGQANLDAVSAGLTQMLLHVLNDEVSEPVIFLPVAGRGAITARLTGVAVDGESLSVTVSPMTPVEREGFLARLKGGGVKGAGAKEVAAR